MLWTDTFLGQILWGAIGEALPVCPLESARTQTTPANAVFVSSVLESGCCAAGHSSGAQAQRRGLLVNFKESKAGEIPPWNNIIR